MPEMKFKNSNLDLLEKVTFASMIFEFSMQMQILR